MSAEPPVRRAVAFIDGQNLFHAAREAFGYTYRNYDVRALAAAVCTAHDWQLAEVRFYTGIPDPVRGPSWHRFWTGKLGVMGKQGVVVFSRPLRYRKRVVHLEDGTEQTTVVGEEKGIDVRLAVDVIRFAHRGVFDVALIFSQDQDLSEVAAEIREVAREQGRWIKVASAFPSGATYANRRGIDKTDWVRIDRATYDACLDRRDYRAKLSPGEPT